MVTTQLLYNGYIEIKNIENEEKIVGIRAKVTNIKIGSKAKIEEKIIKKEEIWKIDDDDDEMIDPEDLLIDEDIDFAPKIQDKIECGIEKQNKPKRACKNW